MRQKSGAPRATSEPVAHERWLQVPNGTVFSVDPDMRLRFEPLALELAAASAALPDASDLTYREADAPCRDFAKVHEPEVILSRRQSDQIKVQNPGSKCSAHNDC